MSKAPKPPANELHAVLDGWQPLRRESESERVRSLVFAVLLHGALFGVMYVGFKTTIDVPPQELAGDPIEAIYVDMPKTTLKVLSSVAATKQTPKPPPRPAQAQSNVTDAKPPVPTPDVPDPLAIKQEEEEQKREEEARKQAEELDKLMRQQQDAQTEKAQLERELLDAQAKAEEARRLAEFAEEDAVLTGTDDRSDLLSLYVSALHNHIQDAARVPIALEPGVTCKVIIVQTVTGDVISVNPESGSCNATPEQQEFLLEAVRRASPLPTKGFESVFGERISLPFSGN